MICTGACCQAFTLNCGKGPLDVHRVRVSEHPGLRQFRHLVRVERVGEQTETFGHYHVFACRALDEHRRCRLHDTKPDACRTYPNDFECTYCGARSDQQARGVALQRRPQ